MSYDEIVNIKDTHTPQTKQWVREYIQWFQNPCRDDEIWEENSKLNSGFYIIKWFA